jgi:outer membrane protein assembly factor BamB
VKLAESLAAELKHKAPTQRVASSDSWPIAWGSPDRARVPAVSAAFGARLFSVEMPESVVRSPIAMRRQIEQMNDTDRKAGTMTGVFPAVDRGEMFFQDNARVYAVSLESGTPLSGWAETYSGERNGQYALPGGASSTPRGQQCTITVTDDAVFAVMCQTDALALQMTGTIAPRGDTRLVCLDRRTGRERWVASSRSLPPDSGLARNLDFSGSPVVVGDTVYVMGRGGKGMQFEDSYVLAFDATSGKSKWLCYLASANTGWWDFGDFSGLFGQRVAHLAYWGGRLYAITNLGALAAVDAHDGTIVWLNLYPRDVPEPNRMMGFHPAWQRRARLGRAGTGSGGAGNLKPWTYNPVMVTAGKVFVLPSDALHVLVYDASTGVEQTRIPLSQFDDADTLVGVTWDKLVVSAAKSVFCINWPTYDEARGAEGNLAWRTSFSRAQFPDDAIRGRSFLTHDAVVVPTAWALHRIALGSGKREASYPDRAEWSEEESAGNVLVMQDRLVVATPTRVNVYTDLRLAMDKLDAEVAAAPAQPEPRLRYAEIMSVAGKWDVALQKLDEAMQLIGGPGAGTANSPARDRLFTDALTFAQRVARDGETGAAQAASFFDRAAAAAATPAQNVSLRLTRARVMKGKLAPDAELKLYQEILADAAMRDVPVASGDGSRGTRAAGAVAERAVTDLLARAGRALYEPYETAAAARLETAQTAKEADAMLAIAREFPNAKAAPRALQAAADQLEASNDPRRAAQVLRQLLFKYAESPERAKTFEALARNYLAMPNRLEVAVARLAQGAAKFPTARLTKPMKLPDGQVLENATFADAVAALRKQLERDESRLLPDMNLPALRPENWQADRGKSKFLPEPAGSAISGISALTAPLPQFARHDRIVAFAPDRGLCVFDAGQNEPRFTSDALDAAPTAVAWSGASLVAWNSSEIAVISADGGKTMWTTAVASLPSVEVATPPAGAGDVADGAGDEANDDDAGADDPRAMNQLQRLELERGLVIRGQAQVMINGRIIRNGRVVALGPQPPAPAQPAAAIVGGIEQIAQVRLLSDRIILGTSTGRMVALDVNDGKVLWQARPAERGATHLMASDDFVVARLDADGSGARVQLLVFDAMSGQLVSRRSFNNDDGAGRIPLNVALAADGTLVWLLPDRLCGKDLFEPGDRLTFEEVVQTGAGGGQPTTFVGSTAPDHLQIVDGRIFALSDAGAYVRVFSLENGKPLRGEQAELFFPTGARQSGGQTLLRPLGRKLYVASPRELKGFDLIKPAFNTNTPLPATTSNRPRDVILTQGYVVVVSEPVGAAAAAARARRPAGAPTTSVQLQPVSRAPVGDDPGRESALLEQPQTITDPATIVAWQPVNGGFYYLTGDQKLHFLKGAGR